MNLSSDQKCKLNSKAIGSKWHTEYICLPAIHSNCIQIIEKLEAKIFIKQKNKKSHHEYTRNTERFIEYRKQI